MEHAVEGPVFGLVALGDIFACLGGLREGKCMVPYIASLLLQSDPQSGDVLLGKLGQHDSVIITYDGIIHKLSGVHFICLFKNKIIPLTKI